MDTSSGRGSCCGLAVFWLSMLVMCLVQASGLGRYAGACATRY